MPFPFIPAALGICFLLVWVFIGGMILRNAQLAVRRELDADANILPLESRPSTWSRVSRSRLMSAGGGNTARAAS